MTSADSTAPLDKMIRSRLGPYVLPLGFWSQWNMFAPNPPISNNYLEAEVTFADGERATWRFPRVDQMGFFERYRGERYRKWASERVVAAGRPLPLVAEAAAGFAARQVERPGNPRRRVELVRYRSQIPSPKRGRLRPHAEPPGDWERQVLYAIEYDAQGRITSRSPATRPATQPGAPLPEPVPREGGER